MTTDFLSENSKNKKPTTIRGSGLKNLIFFLRSRVAIDIG
jgi:hypothetical protein